MNRTAGEAYQETRDDNFQHRMTVRLHRLLWTLPPTRHIVTRYRRYHGLSYRYPDDKTN